MAETELERIKGLEVLTDVHKTQLEDHERRIDKLEEFSVVVDKLNDTVTRQGENIDKLSQNTNSTIKELGENTNNTISKLMDIINDTKKATEELLVMTARIETRQEYYLFDGIKTIVKKIGIKGFVAIGSTIAGIATALHIWG
jgi:polyribonucleotide nucleotidyltransferase